MSLTASHEVYCQNRAIDKSQYESQLLAYPHRAKWKRNSIDVAATKLEAKAKIKQRIEELKKPALDLLEKHRNDLIQKAIDEALKDETNVAVLNKLLDKLVATKTENKTELNASESLIELIKKKKAS